MSISAITSNALSGMQANATRLSATANNVANIDTPGYRRVETLLSPIATGGVSATVSQTAEENAGVDPAHEMVDTITSEIGFKANAAAFETGADLWDVLMSIKRD